MIKGKKAWYAGNTKKPKQVTILEVIEKPAYSLTMVIAKDSKGNMIKDYLSLFSTKKPVAYNPYEY